MSSKDPATLRAEFYNLPDDAMVDRHTVGAVLYASASTLEAEAGKGSGPRYTQIGRRVLYRKADVLAWLHSGRTAANTAQLAQAVPA